MFIGPSYLHCLETMNELSWLPLIATKGMAVASHLNHSTYLHVCVSSVDHEIIFPLSLQFDGDSEYSTATGIVSHVNMHMGRWAKRHG